MYIELMTKSEFKRVLKQQINTKRREYLEHLKSQHKKTQNLVIKDNISEYLVSNKLSNSQKQLLCLLRCNMSKIKVNYKGMHANLICRLCQIENTEETLVHLSVCPFVLSHVPGIASISEDDIYGDIEAQYIAIIIWQQVFIYITEKENGQAHSNCASCAVFT